LSEELTLQPGATAPATPRSRPIAVEVVEHPPSALQYLGNLLGPVVVPLGTAFIVVVFTVFILMKREDVRNRLIRLVAPRQLNTMTQVLDDAALGVSRYLLVQFSLNTVYGCLIATGLYFIGVPNAILWGVLAGLLRFIPYIGPLIGGAVPLLLALGVFDGWTRPMMILGFFTAVELIASQVVEPVIGGSRTGISPLAILVSAVFWGALWGPAGLILSMPLTVCVVVLGRHVPQLEFLNVLLGDEPVLSPEARFYQRLLALDQEEAQSVVDAFLKEQSPIELYDSVIIPALSMAEQDRHKGALDEAKGAFIVQSISEIIGELAEYKLPEPARRFDRPGMRVICLPANDQADEISAAMLAQVLEGAGYPVVCLPVAESVPDAIEEIAGIVPHPGDIVCISSLPPFALLNARTMNKRLRVRFPDLKIIVGLWTFSTSESAAERLGQAFVDTVVTTLADALNQIDQFAGFTSQEASPNLADKAVREAPVARG
jgi:AI-2E family transporter